MGEGQPKFSKHIMWCKHDGKKVFGVCNLPTGAEQAFFTHETYPTVVCAHGFGATHATTLPYAEYLASHGFVTYSIDFCGGGEASKSDGSMLEMTVETERDDLLAAVKLMLDEPFVNKDALFLLGGSQGGYVSAMLAEERPELFKGVALLYPAFILHDDAKGRYPDGAQIPEEEEVMGHRISGDYARVAIARDPYASMSSLELPVLLVHGDADPIVPLAYSERAAKAYPAASLEVLPGAGHGFDGADAQRAAELALDFFRACQRKEVPAPKMA